MSDSAIAPVPDAPALDPASVPDPIDVEVAAVLAEFSGNHRAAIAALLSDLDTLARDYEGSVSRGFVRRSAAPSRRRRA